MEVISEQVVDHGETAELRLRGDLDMAGVLKVEPVAEEVLARGGIKRLLVDLRGLEFIDSTGLGMLLTLHQRAREAGAQLQIVRGPHNVQRVFEVSGVPLDFVDG